MTRRQPILHNRDTAAAATSATTLTALREGLSLLNVDIQDRFRAAVRTGSGRGRSGGGGGRLGSGVCGRPTVAGIVPFGGLGRFFPERSPLHDYPPVWKSMLGYIGA